MASRPPSLEKLQPVTKRGRQSRSHPSTAHTPYAVMPNQFIGFDFSNTTDTLMGVQPPLSLWTAASITAKGEGVPMCYTEGDPGDSGAEAWSELVTRPFAKWSNCIQHWAQHSVPWALEEGKYTCPLKICTNLGLVDHNLSGSGSRQPTPEVCVSTRPEGFEKQVRTVLFCQGIPSPREGDSPRARAVGQEPNSGPSKA